MSPELLYLEILSYLVSNNMAASIKLNPKPLRSKAMRPIGICALVSPIRLVSLVVLFVTTLLPGVAQTGLQPQPTSTNAQRSEPMEIKDKEGNEVFQYLESHALLIGVSNYKYWNVLNGVKSDIDAVDAILTRHGFLTERAPEPKTGDDIYKALKSFFARYGYNPNNRLLIYYAGHGATLSIYDESDSESKRDPKYIGYLVPADAPLTKDVGAFRELAFSIKTFREFSEESSARHIMFVFDSCFAGWVLNREEGSSSSAYINSLTKKPVREFITAGTKDQTVPDESIFRRQFVEAFKVKPI